MKINNNKTTWITFEDLALEYQVSEYNGINTLDCNTYLEQVERDDILPFSNGTFRFSSDIWDFSSYTSLNIDKSELRFFFDSICPYFKKVEKQFVLISLINNHTKIQTIVNKHKYIRKFLRFLESNTIFSISSLTVAILSDFFNECNKKNLSLATIRNYKNNIKDFLLFYDCELPMISYSN